VGAARGARKGGRMGGDNKCGEINEGSREGGVN